MRTPRKIKKRMVKRGEYNINAGVFPEGWNNRKEINGYVIPNGVTILKELKAMITADYRTNLPTFKQYQNGTT